MTCDNCKKLNGRPVDAEDPERILECGACGQAWAPFIDGGLCSHPETESVDEPTGTFLDYIGHPVVRCKACGGLSSVVPGENGEHVALCRTIPQPTFEEGGEVMDAQNTPKPGTLVLFPDRRRVFVPVLLGSLLGSLVGSVAGMATLWLAGPRILEILR
jgi:hypothetical protein